MERWRKKQKVSYLKEMLTTQTSVYGLLGTLAAGTFLTIPFGVGIGLLPVLGYVASASIAALFVPGSARFRMQVDERKRAEAREAARTHLLSEITRRVGPQHAYWVMYHRMVERRDSLRKVAGERQTALMDQDVDRLDDATVDFLGLWLARLAIHDRAQSVGEEEIKRRIAELDQQIEGTEDPANERRLLKARSDLVGLLTRRAEMETRDAQAEARMLAMADTFDEVFQRVMADPTSRENVAAELRVAVDRMNVEEELDHILEHEVEAALQVR